MPFVHNSPARAVRLPHMVFWTLMATCLFPSFVPDFALAEAPVSKLPAGTIVGARPPKPWTHVLFVSSPSVTKGDIDAVPSQVIHYAELLHLVVLARVEELPHHSGNYQLLDVGYGMAIQRGGQLTIATGPINSSDTPPDLGPLEAQVVKGAADSLDDMRTVARRTTLALIDSPAVVFDGKKHADQIMRSLIWVDPKSGKLGHALWLITNNSTGQPSVNQNTASILPFPTHERRALRVDKNEFNFIGIPNHNAFALVALPPGKPLKMPAPLAAAAVRETYTTGQLGELVALLSTAMTEIGVSANEE